MIILSPLLYFIDHGGGGGGVGEVNYHCLCQFLAVLLPLLMSVSGRITITNNDDNT